MNELADRLGMDPVALRERNMVREGQIMPAYYNEQANACALGPLHGALQGAVRLG